ncbi:MAG: acyl-CoA synthetase FdrA [Proteobacteria bacterium]|nr:acyl-CoA synthetase FdrA [Pseudomonadota bacterium]
MILNRVRRGFYADSVVLMRISRALSSQPGVELAAVMIGTRANIALLREAGLLDATGEAAGANDLIIAVRAAREEAAQAALTEADRLLDARVAAAAEGVATVRSVDAALGALPQANLALISVPGEFAAAQARRALARGLHVMIFSDHVSIEDEVELKRAAAAAGLLLMGPDCGTSLIAGTALAFANAVPRGDIGLVSASGTGLQEVSCLLGRAGHGISHGIGVGGRDLHDAVGGLMTLAAIDALDADPATRHIVLISKPPSPAVTARIAARIAQSAKPFTLCLLGAAQVELPRNARLALTLQQAAEISGGFTLHAPPPADLPRRRGSIKGLYAGGTLCAEAQLILMGAGLTVSSNVPVPGAAALADEDAPGHALIDFGSERFTRARLHPMIDPELRNARLAAALEHPQTAVALIDLVIGYGAHPDPAGQVVQVLAGTRRRHAAVIASVTGTEQDPQGYSGQVAALRAAGIAVAASNAQAALWAAHAVAAHDRGPNG